VIIRIVRMKFRQEEAGNFEALFAERKEQIRGFEGCLHLELWRDAADANVFLTYSHWESEAALDHYRFSEFFKDTWGRTKALFAAAPLAWSVNREVVVGG
jgi:quinol monooxygenase YgiN